MNISEQSFIISLYQKHNGDLSYRDIADSTNSHYDTDYWDNERVRSVIRKYRKSIEVKTKVETHDVLEPDCKLHTELNQDGSMISDRIIQICEEDLKSPEKLMEAHKFDVSKWELISCKNNLWHSPMGGGEKVVMYQSKIAVKPRKNFEWTEEYISSLFSNIQVKDISKCVDKTQYENNGKALILPITDLHYALMSYAESSGNEYDGEIAEKLFYQVVNDVLDRTKHLKFEKIYFTIGSDILNADNKAGTTTRGTPQVESMEIEKAIINVTNMLVSTIEKLRTISNVEVVHIPSNHDYHVAFGIANALRIRYENCEDVKIDYDWIERKYKVFGKTLIGFAHDLKQGNINDILNNDARQLLGQTENTVYLLAHYHHEIALDKGGTDVRRLPTISALSRWGYEQGYGAVRKNQSFILDSEYGITDILYTFVKG